MNWSISRILLFYACSLNYMLFGKSSCVWEGETAKMNSNDMNANNLEVHSALESHPSVGGMHSSATSAAKEDIFTLRVKQRIAEDAAERKNVFLSRSTCTEDNIGPHLSVAQSCALKLTVSELAEASRDFDYLNTKLQKDWTHIAEKRSFDINEKKLILLWNLDTARSNWRDCPFCELTINRTLDNPDAVDAVLTNSFALLKGGPAAVVPTREMFPNAKMIAYEYEPTQRSAATLFEGLTDYTFGYRRDSDVVKSNGYIVPRTEPVDIAEILAKNAGRTKMAAWMVSNCAAPSKRLELAQTLQRHGVEVDIIGNCGTFECPKKDSSCIKTIEENYKFYFAFENTLCNHYVTEKFYRALKYNMVPITYGLGHELTGAPRDSYIDVFDFADAKSLAEYILYLDSNVTAYNEYFKWKEFYVVDLQTRHVPKLCELCQLLADGTPPVRTFKEGEYETWVKEGQCIDVEKNTRIWNFVHGLPQE